MGTFFIDTDSGRVATRRQLTTAGLADDRTEPPRPWFAIRASVDCSTLWFAVLRKQERGIWLGTLVLRHSDHLSSLLSQGWEEVSVQEIASFGPIDPDGQQGIADLDEAIRALAEADIAGHDPAMRALGGEAPADRT
ncbi:hypothetical protein [Patulibacter americanus]|uniref:hypothetical protein n=1 Tax=Patulibacter americanus TaxID=588672 RepID=UPI0003B53C29|nr:hypothetical protein [Patulibacter americanus]